MTDVVDEDQTGLPTLKVLVETIARENMNKDRLKQWFRKYFKDSNGAYLSDAQISNELAHVYSDELSTPNAVGGLDAVIRRLMDLADPANARARDERVNQAWDEEAHRKMLVENAVKEAQQEGADRGGKRKRRRSKNKSRGRKKKTRSRRKQKTKGGRKKKTRGRRTRTTKRGRK